MNIKPTEVEINGRSFFTKKGAAERLGIHPTTLQREANRKNIAFLDHPSYGLCFTTENLDEWMSRRTHNAR